MPPNNSFRDENHVTTLLAVTDDASEEVRKLKVDPDTDELLVKASLDSGDIQIGAVEIKDGDSDTRLYVESDGTKNAAFIQANALPLPTGAATAAKQLPDGHNVTIDNPGDIGGGVQYTEDDVATANPVGTALNLIAIDTPANEVAAADNVAARGTRKGEVYVKHVDTLPISAASLPLPTGAATAANQQTDALTDTELRASAVPVSAASLPLPTGAATSANQQTDALTDTELRATPVVVDLGVNNDVTLATLPDTAAGDLAAINASTDGIEALLTTIDADTGAILADTANMDTNLGTIAGDTTSLDTKLLTDVVDDLDSGAGTDNVKVQGIAVAASGGHAVITGDTTNGLDVDVTRVSGTVTVDGSGVTQPVSGTVTANLSATDNAVLDQIELNTDDLLTSTDFAAAFGTAGTPDTQVMSVQGIASMTPLLVDATGQGDVPITLDGESVAVTNTGTFATQIDGTALTRLTDIETNTDFGAVVGGGTEATALRVTLANNSTGVVSVDDNGGSLTVDATNLDIRALTATDVVTANLSATDNAVLDTIDAVLDSIKDTDGIKKITDPLPSGTNTIGQVVLDRPSQGTGRVYKVGAADNVNGNTTVYSVTSMKTLYVTSWGRSFQNTSTVGMAHIRLRDGGATGTILASWTLPTAVAGTIAPNASSTQTFPEPKQFTTDVFIEVVSGTVNFSFAFTGYES